MIYWYWRYIPCRGVTLGFEDLAIYPEAEPILLHIQRRDPKRSIKIKRKHVVEDLQTFRKIDDLDFEIALRSASGDGIFDFNPVHVFSFLLMIRTAGWIYAPAVLNVSMLDEPDSEGPHIYCTPFVDTVPSHYQNITLTAEDAAWIKANMATGLRFTKEAIFQNAMQALTSYHCVPYANAALLLAWSGLEALFKTDTELSFRLCLYIANFLKSGSDRSELFERLRRSYNTRSKVTHGSGGQLTDLQETAHFTRDVLRSCLAKCIELGHFPEPKKLIFAD
ncbi:HEPN domain-containing protein [Bradyrhizobium sp. CCBAU 51765]|uniref:HEPN domain-containing protein n=1 Tax=Bradyrhizobium sp. CCBAU 51765 TaxID=1325102 RepID=UPI00188999D1|nr:HEPN domain-containing protein [Bradyrhizobium sp. CCBAU 51765]QOZ08686.1 hypothetical protein XH96_14955 [Bradyrhizobium sp. CCBAU 51765]